MASFLRCIFYYTRLLDGKQMPQFAHLPLILKPRGQGKLSKRDGDKMGFPVFAAMERSLYRRNIIGYREPIPARSSC